MQSDISVLIIEDEETWMQKIKHVLNQFGYKIAGSAGNLDDALTAIRANNFDIALLDINLHGKNSGIELGKLISGMLKKPFIFITSSVHDGILNETAAAMPSAFLTKPFNPASLYISIQSALHHFSAGQVAETPKTAASPDSFFVKLGNKYVRVEWQNVVYLKSETNHTSIVTNNGDTYMVRSSLQKTLQYVIPDALKTSFVQINRAEVLHTRYLEKIVDNEAITARQSFNISDVYIKNLKQQLNIIS
ncbi:LytR/AlgR family response regulator transcription factor [Mucilaginibacter flavidus]|uniref:LytR/AlgR family response regulator transcription factor n=1 Tax=Mucilaginibacter flavidus TaxID=2949309 RepID=UPI002092D762|nr:response regulator transcription factor [Mucilaginibacter flavidus]MCO5945398.1 response regulator transcription factor [Mucilaginibacter flavidus]